MSTWKHVLEFWFGELDSEGLATKAASAAWWKKDADFDAEIREKFLEDWTACCEGRHGDWLETPGGTLAAVVVLDQFSRNMFRGSGHMYDGDEVARSLVKAGLEQRLDAQFQTDERAFFYMPLMHSEALEDQELCVELFKRSEQASTGRAKARFSANVGYAKQHRDIVARFGRFPHRNGLLGRPSTPEEEAFLREPGSSF